MTVFVHGTGIIPFGRYPDRTLEDLAVPAAAGALAEAAATGDGIDAVYCGNVYGGMLPAHRIAARLGLSGRPAYNGEAACSSSAVALHLAVAAIRAGQLETALVIGVEQLSVFGRGTLRLNAGDAEIAAGLTMPAAYAMRAQRYMAATGAVIEDLAAVSVKNHANGALNPDAQFRRPTPLEEVLGSRPVADPLTLLQCCGSGDGAAAVVVSARPPDPALWPRTVRVAASVVSSGRTGRHDLSREPLTTRVAAQAYAEAGIGPADLGLIELHDAFTHRRTPLLRGARPMRLRRGAWPAPGRGNAAVRPAPGERGRRPAGPRPPARRDRRGPGGGGDQAPGRAHRHPGPPPGRRADPLHRRRDLRLRPRRLHHPRPDRHLTPAPT